MAEFSKILIGIQARSTSERFPRKVFAQIDGKEMIWHVIDACHRAEKYINRYSGKTSMFVETAVLIPQGDEIKAFLRGRQINVFEGPEDDVLERYRMAMERTNADFVCRVTADCPLLPPYLISKHITTAVKGGYDYFSNVEPAARTSADGFDVEVVSKNLLNFAAENATDSGDREHVTTLMRRDPPVWARTGHVVSWLDLSDQKLSVDTEEDLERVRQEYAKVKAKLETADKMAGRTAVYRF